MQVYHGLELITAKATDCAIAIGNFDGVHLGHQALLAKLKAEASQLGVPSAVMTFYPHPIEILRPQAKLERITTLTERLDLLEKESIDEALILQFTERLATTLPEDFFTSYLLRGARAKTILVGSDFRFGKGRAGDIHLLQQLAAKNGVKVEIFPPFLVEGVRVSSSLVREKLREGDTMTAARMMGRPYSLSGRVKRGDGRGSKIGFATANLSFHDEKLLPKSGVYVTRALWQHQHFLSVTNIGTRPTFGSPLPAQVETHLLDCSLPLYDQDLRIEFGERLRDEKKFAGIKELTDQIEKDIEAARQSRTFGKE